MVGVPRHTRYNWMRPDVGLVGNSTYSQKGVASLRSGQEELRTGENLITLIIIIITIIIIIIIITVYSPYFHAMALSKSLILCGFKLRR